MIVRFGKAWGQHGTCAIECGEWNFNRLTDLMDYYGIKNPKGVAYESYINEYGKEGVALTYEGEATLNMETERNYSH